MTLEEQKVEAKRDYREAREVWMKNPTNDNWRRFCNAKRNCMLLGARI